MSDLGLALFQLGGLFTGLINIYIWVLIIAALLSFVNPDPYNPVVQFLHRVTQPTYSFVRRVIKTNIGGIDLAPLIIIVALQIIVIIFNLLLSTLVSAL